MKNFPNPQNIKRGVLIVVIGIGVGVTKLKNKIVTGIKLKLEFDSPEDKLEMKKYFEEYSKAVTFAAKKIAYLRNVYEDIPREKTESGWKSTISEKCSLCKEEQELSKKNRFNGEMLCFSCYNKQFGKQMIRKKLIQKSTGKQKRKVDPSINIRNSGKLTNTSYHLAFRDASQLLEALRKQRKQKNRLLKIDRFKLRKFEEMYNDESKRFKLPFQKRQRVARYVHIKDKDSDIRGWSLAIISNKIKILKRNIERRERSLSKSTPILQKGTKISIMNNIVFNLSENKVKISLWKPKWYSFYGTNVTKRKSREFFKEKLSKIEPKKYGILIRKIKKGVSSPKLSDMDFYLQYPIEETIEEKEPSTIMGIDLGLNKLAAISIFNIPKSLENLEKPIKVKMFRRNDTSIRIKRRKLLRSFSKKHNRLRKIKKLTPIEKSIEYYYHNVTKQIVDMASEFNSIIVMEDLRDMKIKSRIRQSKKQKYNISLFTYKKIRNLIEYKSRLKGIKTMVVDPEGTSYTCSKCGSNNTIRPFNGSYGLVHCRDCMVETKMLDADYNASVNIVKKGLNMMLSNK